MKLCYLVAALLFFLACLPDPGECHARATIDRSDMMDSDNHTCEEEYEECPDPALCCPSEGNNVGLAFGLTIGAGFATNIGALLSLLPCFKRTNVILLSVGLALAAGLMVYVSFIEILSKAENYFCCRTPEHSTLASTGCFFMGILLTLLLQLFLDQLQRLDIKVGCSNLRRKKKATSDEEVGDQERNQSLDELKKTQKESAVNDADHQTDYGTNGGPKDGSLPGVRNITAEEGEQLDETAFDSTAAESETVEAPDNKTSKSRRWIRECGGTCTTPTDSGEYNSEVMDLLGQESKQLHKMGLFTAAAIGIHNFPEGIATFIVGLATPELGIPLAIAVAIHNIPEGSSVAIPIYYATGKKWKGLLWAFLSGISEPIGALLAYLIFKDIFGPLVYGFIFGFVAGMMVIVAMKDLLPTARKFDKRGMIVTGFFIVGMFIMAASLVFFAY